ncbi:hypothetical protein GIB67_012149 [Kingdonia uniflora]|uniref:PABC domain-containing protein n=1 Tax=Kingdonia uniflora TaxID=39325 RepID=A0A7J7N9W2_9MAGN|nr:hypothetical protein GIB67_012149 [Kingdonia uniflora]
MGELRLDNDARLPSILNWTFTTVLANASPEHQRALLGEKLCPLVDQLEHGMAGKVTGMLLELDQPKVLHLLESPKALKAKVSEAMEVLRNAASWLQSNILGGLVTPVLSPSEHQRMMFGWKLYPLVDQQEYELAFHVTGMLLEMDQPQVFQLLESREGLKAKVAKAMKILNTSQTIPVVDLVTQLANASREHQRKMFGMSLNPLVDQLVNENVCQADRHASEVTVCDPIGTLATWYIKKFFPPNPKTLESYLRVSRVNGFAVKTVDTTGAGDAFVGDIFLPYQRMKLIPHTDMGVEHLQHALEISPRNVAAYFGLASRLLGLSKECVNNGVFSWGASLLEEASDVANASTVLTGKCFLHLEVAW